MMTPSPPLFLLTEAHFQFEGGRVGKKVADLGKQQNCFFSVRYHSTLPALRAPLNPTKTKSCSKISCFYLQAAWV
jgi:hypothetical protein